MPELDEYLTSDHDETGLACVSLSLQIADSCAKLYRFWDSIRDAPHEVAAILQDLQYLATVVDNIARDTTERGSSVAMGLQCCQSTMKVGQPFMRYTLTLFLETD